VATVICSRGLYTPIYRMWARPRPPTPPPISIRISPLVISEKSLIREEPAPPDITMEHARISLCDRVDPKDRVVRCNCFEL
jgi:hypothetical protein